MFGRFEKGGLVGRKDKERRAFFTRSGRSPYSMDIWKERRWREMHAQSNVTSAGFMRMRAKRRPLRGTLLTLFAISRQTDLDDSADIRYIDTSRCHIARKQDCSARELERFERAVSCGLRFPGVDLQDLGRVWRSGMQVSVLKGNE